jgi:hypothetical protein
MAGIPLYMIEIKIVITTKEKEGGVFAVYHNVTDIIGIFSVSVEGDV